MFEIKFQSVFSILQLLPIISRKRRSVEVVANGIGFISDFVAFSADRKPKSVSYWLGKFSSHPPASSITAFFSSRFMVAMRLSVFAYALVAVFEFVPDAFCPRVIGVPGFYAAADSCNLWLIQVGHKFS